MPEKLTKITAGELEDLMFLVFAKGYYAGHEIAPHHYTEDTLKREFDKVMYELKLKTK